MSVIESAAPELNTEVDKFFSSTGGEEPAAETASPEAVAAPAEATSDQTTPPAPSWLDEPADDDNLPPSLKGKPRREVWAKTATALAEQHQANFQKNEFEARAKVAEASLNAALSRLQQIAAPPPRPKQPHEEFGLKERNDVYENLPSVVDRIPQYVADKARELSEQQIAPLQNQVYTMVAEQARKDARPADIDAVTWESLRPRLAAIMWAQELSPAIGANWQEAAKQYRSDAAKLVPQQVRQETTAPPTGNARPGTVSQQPKKFTTTGNKHTDKAIKEHLETWNKAGVKISFEDMAEMLANDPMRGIGGDW